MVKELTKSRDEWKEKSIRHKARADKLETVSINKVNEWKTKNIAKTLFTEKIKLNKKIELSYFINM